MQTDEFELSPSILDTPSLMTPNIVSTIKSIYNPLHTNFSNNNNNNNENHSTSNPSSITNETSSSTSSAEVKVLKIEDELKHNLPEPRQPTPSPFQKMAPTDFFISDKSVITNDDGTTIEIPSTADVVKEIEALTNTNPLQFQIKTLINDNNERGTTTTTINDDNIRYDSPPTSNIGVIVSPPKKKFLIRSQSHTESPPPIQNNNNLSQSQKINNDNSILNSLDDENSMDDSGNNHFTRAQDLPVVTTHHNNNQQQFKSNIDNRNEQHLNLEFKTDHNGVPHTIIKPQQQQQQQPIIINNKRTFQQANIGNNISTLTKANTIIIPHSSLNEVTSTDQLSTIKRQRTTPISTNTTVMNFRPSFPSSATVATVTNPSPTNGSNPNIGSDDQRRKQIRDSNREAARRCRERRRNYIEQLEGNLEHHKGQIKQLTEKLARIERENTQLRAILSETKVLHSSSRLSVNESHIDYPNIISTSGMDHNSESNHQIDGGTISRNYLNRNNL